MTKFLSLFFACLMFTSSVFAAQSTVKADAGAFIEKLKVNAADIQELQGRKISEFRVDKNSMSSVFNGNNERLELNNFPVTAEKNARIFLNRSLSPVDENTVIVAAIGSGEVAGKRPTVSYYEGKIEGQPHSDVFIVNTSFGLVGSIIHENGEAFSISPKFDGYNKDLSVYSINNINAEDLMKEKGMSSCAVDEADVQGTFADVVAKNPSIMAPTDLKAKPLLVATLAFDANFEFVHMWARRLFGIPYEPWDKIADLTEAQWDQLEQACVDYMTAIVARGTRIYEKELSIMLKIAYMKVWLDPAADPYFWLWGYGLGDKLDQMDVIWSSRSSVKRSIASVFTDNSRQPTSSSTLGIANLNGLCSTSRGYSALGMTSLYNYPALFYNQDIMVAVHEWGHNFGSPHTHHCNYWGVPLDSCVNRIESGDASCIDPGEEIDNFVGTIMSYCHFSGGIKFEFHPKTALLIRNEAEASPVCVSAPSGATVRLVSPIGAESIGANTTHMIKFLTTKVDNVKLKYSADNGGEWHDIATVNSKNFDYYNWAVPNINSTEVIVRIEDATNPAVFDQSILPNSILLKGITIISPKENERIGVYQVYQITWQKALVDKVNIDISTDGGESWKPLPSANDLGGTLYSSNFEDKETPAKIRISDASNPAVFAIKDITLVKESMNVITPIKDGIYCYDDPKFRIEWENDLVKSPVKLELSIDDGQTWPYKLGGVLGFDPSQRTDTVWDLTTISNMNPPVEDAIIRVVFTGSGNIELGRSEKFVLSDDDVNCITSVNEFHNTADFRILSIVPNPAEKLALVTVEEKISLTGLLDVQVVDATGNVLMERQIPSGGMQQSSFNLNLEALPSGSYFLLISAGQYSASTGLKVVR